jgi:hypothetical protein
MPRSKIKKPSSPKFSARPGRKRSRVVVADARESARATDSCSATLVTTAHVEEASELALRERRRIARSNEVRHKRQLKHWSNEWLERAHQKYPALGRESLALHARQMHSEACDARLARQKLAPEIKKKVREREAKKRARITEDRARTYLERIRKK